MGANTLSYHLQLNVSTGDQCHTVGYFRIRRIMFGMTAIRMEEGMAGAGAE
jgi:hypothetical protein